MTTSNSAFGSMPAEWEQADGVLLAWPHEDTDWAPMLDEARRCYVEIIKAVAARAKAVIIGPELDSARAMIADPKTLANCIFLEMPTNDTWTRDYGPVCATDPATGAICARDFIFNGWGMKFAANYDNMATRRLMASGIVSPVVEYSAVPGFVAEGGGIETNGKGLLLTTASCVFSPNRNEAYGKEMILKTLLNATGCESAYVIRHGDIIGDDTDGHIDTLARFLAPDTLAYASCDRPDDENYASLAAMEKEIEENKKLLVGHNGHMLPLPIPEPIYDEKGDRLPATYANFLILNDAVLVPLYGDEKYDKMALAAISSALPNHEIVPIDCRALIRQHGSLHCATMQLPHGFLS